MKSKAPLIFGIVMLTVFVGFLAFYRSSPGELSFSHRDIVGSSLVTDCKKCHTKNGIDFGCLQCHEEIGNQLKSKAGFHAYLAKNKPLPCSVCHSEHNGEKFSLINSSSWRGDSERDFKHPHVSFQLKGKHDLLECQQCHELSSRSPFVLPGFQDHPRLHTKLGLNQQCSSCHKDPHASGRSPACDKCHSQTSFTQVSLFNHDQYFPLRNGHTKVSCQKCHPISDSQGAQSSWAPFDRVKGSACQDCHQNPHRVNWGKKCDQCHSKEAVPWSEAKKKLTKKDHAKTPFPLVFPHQAVSCDKCHASSLPFLQKFADRSGKNDSRYPRQCEACHHDVHGGQFLPEQPHCVSCHTEKQFLPSRYSIRDHKTYPLVGGHAAVACIFCHKAQGSHKIRQYKKTPQYCSACHEDIHQGQFVANKAKQCEECHNSAKSWSLLNFDHNQHSSFKLDQAHRSVKCLACHPKKSTSKGVIVLYKPLSHRCESCHGLEFKE